MKMHKYFPALLVIALVFFIIGFSVGINGVMIPVLEKTFLLSKKMSYFILFSTFSAFFLFAVPSGIIVKKIGYKKSIIIALMIMSLSMFSFIFCSKGSNSIVGFYLYIFVSFLAGIGNTLLQTAINPYVTICGSPKNAAQRMCIMGIMNQLAWFLGPIFLSLFVDVKNPVIEKAVIPFSIAGGLVFLLSVFICFFSMPEIVVKGECVEDHDSNLSGDNNLMAVNRKLNIFCFPHLFLGLIAIFIYVGVETLPMASIIDFAISMNKEDPSYYSIFPPLGMIIGYVISTIILQYIDQDRALSLFSLFALIVSVFVILLPAEIAIYFFMLLGFSHSIMWGCIWALTISDLGKYTKMASSILVIGMVGGAVIPFLFSSILELNDSSSIAFQRAYLILIPAYLYILFYSLVGYKVGRV